MAKKDNDPTRKLEHVRYDQVKKEIVIKFLFQEEIRKKCSPAKYEHEVAKLYRV